VTATILAPGETLGGYRILEVIGIGGMAIVYRAEQLSLGREVALKVLAPSIADDREFRERFRREGKHVAALEHPNIVAIYDFGEADGRLFLAMRLVRGVTLADRQRAGALTADQTLAVLAPIADALDSAHAAGVVHRDVKPQNILISDRGHPYLADFGVAKGVVTTGVTAGGGFVGSCYYAAPEQILGRPVTAATDIYGLTAVLYQCFTGRLPYARDTEAGVLHAHVYEPTPVVDAQQAGAGPFNEMIARGMAKEPQDRFAEATGLMQRATTIVGALPETRRDDSPTFIAEPQADDARTIAMPGTSATVAAAGTADAAADPGTGDSVDIPQIAPARRRRKLAAAAIGGTIIILGAIIVAILATGSSARPERYTSRMPPFTITYTRPWRSMTTAAVAASPLVNGAADAGSVRATAARGRSIRLVAGGATLTAGQLLKSSPIPGGAPPALVDDYGKPDTSANATVAGHPARSYMWISHEQWLVAYVLPTIAADTAIMCQATKHSVELLHSCGLMAQHASVRAAGITKPGAYRPLDASLVSTLTPLRRIRSGPIGLAATPLPTRAAAATAFAHTDSRAAESITDLSVPPRYRSQLGILTAALKRDAAAFGVVAAADRADNPTAYVRDVRRVSAAGNHLESVVDSFLRFGFSLPTPAQPRLAGPPPLQQSGGSSTGTTAPPTGTYPSTPTPQPPPAGGSSGGGSGTHTGGGSGGGSGGNTGGYTNSA
jgi:serine/threonine protein kinase